MKVSPIIACSLLSFCTLLSGQNLSAAESGMNGKVEWNIRQNWQTSSTPVQMVHSLDGKHVYILDDKEEVAIYTTDGKLQGSVPVAKGVSQIDISPQGDILYLLNTEDKSFSAVSVAFVVDIDTTGAPFEGPVDAPVTMVIFTDFECPYCSQVVPLIKQVLKKNPESVKLVFKNMPLRFHKMAEPSARAALAAFEQGKFWEYHDLLFAEKKLSEDKLTEFAKKLKLDMGKFKKDMASDTIKTKVQKDIQDAQQIGVTGTPTIFINGRKTQKRSLDYFQSLIDEEIKKVGQN